MPASSFPRRGVGGFFDQHWGNYIFIASGYDFFPVLHIYSCSSNPTPSPGRQPSDTQQDRCNKNDGAVSQRFTVHPLPRKRTFTSFTWASERCFSKQKQRVCSNRGKSKRWPLCWQTKEVESCCNSQIWFRMVPVDYPCSIRACQLDSLSNCHYIKAAYVWHMLYTLREPNGVDSSKTKELGTILLLLLPLSQVSTGWLLCWRSWDFWESNYWTEYRHF